MELTFDPSHTGPGYDSVSSTGLLLFAIANMEQVTSAGVLEVVLPHPAGRPDLEMV